MFHTCVSLACSWGFTLPQNFDSCPFGTNGTHVLHKHGSSKTDCQNNSICVCVHTCCSFACFCFHTTQNMILANDRPHFGTKGTHVLQKKRSYQIDYQNNTMYVCVHTCFPIACFWGFILPQKFDSGPKQTALWNKRSTCLTKEQKL